MAGLRRCGANDRLICAVTTITDAIPRRPYALSSAVVQWNQLALLTSAHTTSLLGVEVAAMIGYKRGVCTAISIKLGNMYR